MLHVLLLEDDEAHAELVLALLDEVRAGAVVAHCRTLREAVTLLAAGSAADVVLADLSLPDASGLEALHALRDAAPDLPILVLTGLDDDAVALDALAAGAQDFVGKDGLTGRLLLRAVRYAAERARAERTAAAAARWTAALLDGLESPTCAVDGSGRVLALNTALRDGEGLPVRCSAGDDLLAALAATGTPHGTALLQGLRDVLSGRAPRTELDCATADDRWWSVRVTPLPGGAGAVLTQVDVTVLKRAQQELTSAALHDALTGLPNRTLLADRLSQAFSHAEREGRVVAVLFFDLDRFKLVNDALGHAAGDAVLVAVAERLVGAARSSETVARVSGDEYVVVCVADDAVDAQRTAARLCAAVNGPVHVDGREVPVTAAAGLAVAAPGDSAEDVLRAADEAMYAAKARGAGRLEVASAALRAQLVRRLDVEAALEAALAEDRLEVHYQPVVRLADGTPTGAEALVRLRDPDGALVPPADFIEVAERSGLIVPLGHAVLERACAEAAGWSGAAAALTVAVNLSTRQLAQPDVVDAVAASLARTGLDPARLVLEVTESAVVEDADAALRALTALKALGVRTAIDDFGTGYSSFVYLKQFPVDLLKIDRSFVAGMLDSADDAAIVASIVRLGLDVGVTLVAEGVETEEQRRHLVGLGCTEAQGYLFSRPVPAQVLPEALAGCRRAPAAPPPLSPRSTAPPPDPAVVARVHDLSRAGASLHTIAAVLNAEGVLSPVGRRWHPRSVARLLDDERAWSAS